jgi:hypothetical protein
MPTPQIRGDNQVVHGAEQHCSLGSGARRQGEPAQPLAGFGAGAGEASIVLNAEVSGSIR